MKIAVGLSGGVDSAIAAYLLKKAGHEVAGITMKIWNERYQGRLTGNACFGPEEEHDIEDARKVAEFLGIPFHVLDLSDEYGKSILGYFTAEYRAGRTPNPCMRCNRLMKFELLLERARAAGLEFDAFATGHYARVVLNPESARYELFKGKDPTKDQSYFLSLLSQEQLASCVFPLGEMLKKDVKAVAKELGLSVHEKKESQDFYSGDYTELLDASPPQGDIVDTRGRVIGKHKGICFYTIGQRRGLGIGGGEALYVVDIRRDENLVIAGTDADLFKPGLTVSAPNWVSIAAPSSPFDADVRIRYRHEGSPARVEPRPDGTLRVVFREPQRAITPGQFAVFYEGEKVLGGGVIEQAIDPSR